MDDPGTANPAMRDGTEIAAGFTIKSRGGRAAPLVFSVPHAGRNYPPEILSAMRAPQIVPLRLEDRLVDHVAGLMADAVDVPCLVATVPRAVIDLNRAEDDIDWGMVAGTGARTRTHSASNRRARSGLGLVPRRIPGVGDIWRQPITASDLERRIEVYHRPYHWALDSLLEKQRDHWGATLLVDIHSMPPLPTTTPGELPAQFVIGDRFAAACEPVIAATALHGISRDGWRVSHNRPYAGGYILERHGKPRRRIYAIQIEICRSLYLDAQGNLDQAGAAAVGVTLRRLVADLGSVVADFGSARALPFAAE